MKCHIMVCLDWLVYVLRDHDDVNEAIGADSLDVAGYFPNKFERLLSFNICPIKLSKHGRYILV